MSDPRFTLPPAEVEGLPNELHRAKPDTPTMRDQCIDEMMRAEQWSSFFSRDDAGRLFDAVMVRLQEPSEGMIEAGKKGLPWGVHMRDAWPLIIQHIRDGGS